MNRTETLRRIILNTPLGAMAVRQAPGWQQGTLAIRPERIRIAPGRPQTNGVLATITELIYRGDHVDLFVEPSRLRIRIPPTLRLCVGQQIWLELPPEHLEVLHE